MSPCSRTPLLFFVPPKHVLSLEKRKLTSVLSAGFNSINPLMMEGLVNLKILKSFRSVILMSEASRMRILCVTTVFNMELQAAEACWRLEAPLNQAHRPYEPRQDSIMFGFCEIWNKHRCLISRTNPKTAHLQKGFHCLLRSRIGESALLAPLLYRPRSGLILMSSKVARRLRSTTCST